MQEQYTNWVQNFGTRETFVCNKSHRAKTIEITAVPNSRSAATATTGYGYKNSTLPLAPLFRTCMPSKWNTLYNTSSNSVY